MNKINLIVIMLLGLVSTAQAANFQVPKTQTIVQMQTYKTYAVIEYSPGETNALACGANASVSSKKAAIVFGDDANWKVQYAAALSAYLNGKTVGMGITNSPCFSGFGGGIPTIYRLDVTD
tara:strand:+ start:787 stop:1149 length:363 start_codon:yes stop_codon:yes gene_type:complete